MLEFFENNDTKNQQNHQSAAGVSFRNSQLSWLIEQGEDVIWNTILQAKRPNQQYQSTEGRQNTHKNTKTISRHTYKNT